MALDEVLRQYRDTELFLLRLIAEAVASEQVGTAEFYRQQHQTLSRLMAQAEKAVDALQAGVAKNVLDDILSGYGEGMVQAAAGATVPAVVDTAAVGLLAAETVTALRSQRPMILRSVNDAYQQITAKVAQQAMVSGAPYTRVLQASLDEYATRGIKGFVDRAGRQWGMDSYAEMAVRTAKNRAQNQGRQDQYQDMGVDLILTSWHHASAPQCIPYQGKVLSLDGVAGPRLVQDRSTGNFITVDVVATLQEAEANGYHHVNCRHVDTAYVPGQPLPEVPDVPPEEHDALQRQRAIERQIRDWKKRGAVALDPQAKRRADGFVRKWQAEMRTHVKTHDAFLVRQSAREQIRTASGS